ncbi:MAG: FAD-binding protein [Prevotellaceae bacterium]|jgi:uncharacterized FAD-dependent dehydrogenase|nr:FAD-binding protein [Prevotellaceae bacterium]
MITIDVSVTPEIAASPEALKRTAANALQMPVGDIVRIDVLRRAIDARRGRPKIQLRLGVNADKPTPIFDKKNYKNVAGKPPVIIVGSGPAGMFAALKLLEHGLRPIVIERGKEVSARKRDLALLSRQHSLNADSNWCFGEGGAGTFSDGKLYTRSNKRGNIDEILQQLVAHGANRNILEDAHPHIGTDKLPAIVSAIRQTVEDCGGIYHFNTRAVDLAVKNGAAQGVVAADGTCYEGIAVILATGHSAREVYQLFDRRRWLLESKAFAMGVRVEHPQALINEIQYGKACRRLVETGLLPPATYSLTAQTGGRGVFSFCMCPGGIMAPAATSPDEVVVNGMSNSQRNSPYANAGIVVQVFPSDCRTIDGASPAMAGMALQQATEQAMFVAANHSQAAPTQRLADFVNGRFSALPIKTSYLAGNTPAPLHALLPDVILQNLQQAFKQFDRKMRGFLSSDATVTAIESRSSSPVRIPRDPASLQHPQLANLYPCGEGAGYAGGITSSAIDGVRCAEKIIEKVVSS